MCYIYFYLYIALVSDQVFAKVKYLWGEYLFLPMSDSEDLTKVTYSYLQTETEEFNWAGSHWSLLVYEQKSSKFFYYYNFYK